MIIHNSNFHWNISSKNTIALEYLYNSYNTQCYSNDNIANKA